MKYSLILQSIWEKHSNSLSVLVLHLITSCLSIVCLLSNWTCNTVKVSLKLSCEQSRVVSWGLPQTMVTSTQKVWVWHIFHFLNYTCFNVTDVISGLGAVNISVLTTFTVFVPNVSKNRFTFEYFSFYSQFRCKFWLYREASTMNTVVLNRLLRLATLSN